MHFAPWVTLVYTVLVLVGGIMGYLKAHSRISLITGMVFGLLLLISSTALFKGMKIGAYGALLFSLILLCFFSWRFIQTVKFFPSGMMALISLSVLVLLAIDFKKHYFAM